MRVRMDRRGRRPMTNSSIARCHRLIAEWQSGTVARRCKVGAALSAVGLTIEPNRT